MVTVYVGWPVIGDGSLDEPRRPSMWGRLDMLLATIADGLVCLQPDGTVIQDHAFQKAGVALSRDLGPVGVIAHTLNEDLWALALAYHSTVVGPGRAVWGDTIPDLRASCEQQIPSCLGVLSSARVTLPEGDTLAAQAHAAIRDQPASGLLAAMKTYYLDRMSGSSMVDVPNLIKPVKVDVAPVSGEVAHVVEAARVVDGAEFTKVLTSMRESPKDAAAVWFHEAYELFMLDSIARGT